MSQLDKLKARREALDARIKEEAAKQQKRERTNGNRQKVILGGWLMKHRPDLVNKIVTRLDRDQDRKAFEGWEPLPVPERTEGGQQ